MPVAPNRTRRGHGGGRPRKPNPRPVRYLNQPRKFENKQFISVPR